MASSNYPIVSGNDVINWYVIVFVCSCVMKYVEEQQVVARTIFIDIQHFYNSYNLTVQFFITTLQNDKRFITFQLCCKFLVINLIFECLITFILLFFVTNEKIKLNFNFFFMKCPIVSDAHFKNRAPYFETKPQYYCARFSY